MKIETLYRYERNSGEITVSPQKPEDKEYTEMYRLIAGDGMILANGEIQTPCIDVDSAEGWTEIDKPEEEEVYPVADINNNGDMD